MMFGQRLPIGCKLDINRKCITVEDPSIVGDEQADQIPWQSMDKIDEIDLRGCKLTRLPLGLADIPNAKTLKLRMDSDWMEGLSGHLIRSNVSLEQLVETMKQIREGTTEEKCRTVKLLVVGDAAAGKTTLVGWLQGKTRTRRGDGSGGIGVSTPTLATDGIDLGEITIDDVRLSCWDFAGQVGQYLIVCSLYVLNV